MIGISCRSSGLTASSATSLRGSEPKVQLFWPSLFFSMSILGSVSASLGSSMSPRSSGHSRTSASSAFNSAKFFSTAHSVLATRSPSTWMRMGSPKSTERLPSMATSRPKALVACRATNPRASFQSNTASAMPAPATTRATSPSRPIPIHFNTAIAAPFSVASLQSQRQRRRCVAGYLQKT